MWGPASPSQVHHHTFSKMGYHVSQNLDNNINSTFLSAPPLRKATQAPAHLPEHFMTYCPAIFWTIFVNLHECENKVMVARLTLLDWRVKVDTEEHLALVLCKAC